MIERIISGGQTGVDQSALSTAFALSIPTGGWACSDWCTEDGPAPWLADYGLHPHHRPGYSARTEANVQDSTGTLLITYEFKLSGGSYLTACLCESLDRPLYIIRLCPKPDDGLICSQMDGWRGPGYVSTTPWGSKLSFSAWIGIHGIKILNVAGPRESKSPGIFERASSLLIELLTQ